MVGSGRRGADSPSCASVCPLPSALCRLPLSNPLSLLPIALAAGNGRVDGVPARYLVAAGFTLLQRSAPLVRALAGRRSAILLPPSGAVVTALAASDGRGAVLLAPDAADESIAHQLDDADVGAVFTTRALEARVPSGERAIVMLDDAPRTAAVRAQDVESMIDLGTHFGLDLEGEEDEGRDEECVVVYTPPGDGQPMGFIFTHRSLLAAARGAVDATSMLASDHLLAALPPSSLAGFMVTFAAPLLAGARVTTMARFDAAEALRLIERDAVTMLVGSTPMFRDIADALAARGSTLSAPSLRVCIGLGIPADAAVQERWHRDTGTELRQAFGVTEAPLCLFNAPHFPNRRGTLGIPFPGVQVSVRDAGSGGALPAGTAGALCVRGVQLFSGYVRHAGDAGAVPGAPPVGDGWLQTRTTARERADGAFELA